MGNSYKKASELISVLVNIDFNDDRQMIVLGMAIEYADLSNYIVEIKTVEDSIMNEIFTTKAVLYFKRKMLNPFTDMVKIENIRGYEHRSVAGLRMKLPPKSLRVI